jgi:hypothetical protein
MTPYVRKGRKIFEMRVPLRNGGDGPIRTCGTTDKVIADEMEALVKRLAKKEKYWPLMEAVTQNPPRLTLKELWHADNNDMLDELMASLDDPDLAEYLDDWEKWVNSNLNHTTTAAMYRMQVSTLIAPDGGDSEAFPKSELTTARVNTWLADYGGSSGYKRKLLYALFSFIRYLIEAGVFETNPIDKITRPKKGKKDTRWETEENDIRIVVAAPAEYQGLFAFIKSTGSEVSPPLADEFTAREIELWPEDEGRYCGLAHVPGTKTETRDRHDVYIEKWARPFLERALHGLLPNAKVFPGISRYQAHWHHQNAADAVQVLRYTLRHARHSWAVRARKCRPQVSFEAIAEQLGNTVAVVADVYAQYKMSPEERRKEGAPATNSATQTESETKIIPIRESASQ